MNYSSKASTISPTFKLTSAPTKVPWSTNAPSYSPTKRHTRLSSAFPTNLPSNSPIAITSLTEIPSITSTISPTTNPSNILTKSPNIIILILLNRQ